MSPWIVILKKKGEKGSKKKKNRHKINRIASVYKVMVLQHLLKLLGRKIT